MTNDLVNNLPPYPMEELTRIKKKLSGQGKKLYDFGTGDPKIPTWSKIVEAFRASIPEISQYPSVYGSEALTNAIWNYLSRNHGIKKTPELMLLPTSGSKEAIFHVALCLFSPNRKQYMVYPNPGYPVYKVAAQFGGGVPYPYDLNAENGFLLEPWRLPEDVQKNTAALWINYPHNPTGAMMPKGYMEEVLKWCKNRNALLLSDDCYVDIYDPKLENNPAAQPKTPLSFDYERVISFMSLSKRSGLTGYRSGFMAGPTPILKKIAEARANFGVAISTMIQAASVIAWDDENHVKERRKIFAHRMQLAGERLQKLGLLGEIPDATFYLWCKTPPKWQDDDVAFSLGLAEKGVIISPSQWLSEGIRGWVRFALVPDEKEMMMAMDLVEEFLNT